MPPVSVEASRWLYRLAVIETSECPLRMDRRCSSILPSASRVMQVCRGVCRPTSSVSWPIAYDAGKALDATAGAAGDGRFGA